jgi:VIT1/CCC1 family predicted Fe2+/Mn2+ transporter
MPSRLVRDGTRHRGDRSNWLRAAVLGANDGILSTASLVLGVAGAGGSNSAVVTAGIAGLVAGALSMAAGEYVSVSSQRDTEEADLRVERRELAADPEGELRELAEIYRNRGLSEQLALQVAEALTERNPLAAHSRDELGLDDHRRARPLQAAWSSASAFSAGAVLPLAGAVLAPTAIREAAIVVIALLALALLGATGARLGGAPALTASARVVLWGALAMAVTFGIGAAVGGVV